MNQIFTVGHSNHDLSRFLQILTAGNIQVVVDVRSAPYSKYVRQYNKREIENSLAEAKLQYIFMGDAIGGKPSDPKYLDDTGQARYEKIAASAHFQSGIERLITGLRAGWKIVLMCAEENPLQCHRHHLIANELECRRNIPVWHMRAEGKPLRAKHYFNRRPEQGRLF